MEQSRERPPSPLERLARHELMLGRLFLARCALRAEELGFDLVFGLAQWLGKGGYGRGMRFREHEIDPFITERRPWRHSQGTSS